MKRKSRSGRARLKGATAPRLSTYRRSIAAGMGLVCVAYGGDVLLVVTRLDRLARSTRDLLSALAAIAGKGAKFRSSATQEPTPRVRPAA
jgi:hypothetical protein